MKENFNERQFEEMVQKHGAEAAMEGAYVPADVTAEERAESLRALKDLRARLSEEDMIIADFGQLLVWVLDHIKSPVKGRNFAYFLKEFVRASRQTQVAFAEGIGMHQTELSNLLHGRQKPSRPLFYRLEHYCGGIIEAKHWLRLYHLDRERVFVEDQEAKAHSVAKVLKPLVRWQSLNS